MNINYDEKSCGVLVFREENGQYLFLTLRYPEGHWDLPKGHVEDSDAGERETAARELLEETGIADIEFVDGFREEISYKYIKKGKPSHKLVVFFLARTKLSDIRLSHEHHDSQWLNYDDALARLTFENARSIVKKSKALLKI